MKKLNADELFDLTDDIYELLVEANNNADNKTTKIYFLNDEYSGVVVTIYSNPVSEVKTYH